MRTARPPRRIALLSLIVLIAAGLSLALVARDRVASGGAADPAGDDGELEPTVFDGTILHIEAAPEGFRYALSGYPGYHPGLFLAGADRSGLYRARIWVRVPWTISLERRALLGFDGNIAEFDTGDRVRVEGWSLPRPPGTTHPLVRADTLTAAPVRPFPCRFDQQKGLQCGESVEDDDVRRPIPRSPFDGGPR